MHSKPDPLPCPTSTTVRKSKNTSEPLKCYVLQGFVGTQCVVCKGAINGTSRQKYCSKACRKARHNRKYMREVVPNG